MSDVVVIAGILLIVIVFAYRWLGRRNRRGATSHSSLIIEGSGDFEEEVSGESKYQPALSRIAGEDDEGVEHECIALLIPEPSNPYDRDAIRVEIDGMLVGYIPRQRTSLFHHAIDGRVAACRAMIVGGWKRGRRERAHYGVRLDVDHPIRLSHL